MFIFSWIVAIQRSDEKNILKTLELLNPDLNAPNCLYRRRSYNALHIAGIHGFTTVCKEILVRGFDRLLMQTCTGGTLPVSLAVTYSKYSTAQALLQAMDPRLVYEMVHACTCIILKSSTPLPKICVPYFANTLPLGFITMFEFTTVCKKILERAPVFLEINISSVVVGSGPCLLQYMY